jgi:FKBP-type peptidyl-prolyl cis-trans isomerase FklB
MKKLFSIITLCFAAFIAVSFSFCTAQTPKAQLKTTIDSLSYAYGINLTQGLDQYLVQQGVDEANKADFVKGLLEGAKVNKEDKKELARFLGLQIGQQVATQMLPNINSNVFGGDETKTLDKNQFLAGFIAVTLGQDLAINKEEAGTFAETLAAKLREEGSAIAKEKNAAFLEKNKTKAGIITTESGLQYEVIKEGDGVKPAAEDVVKVDYVGTTIDGKEFDSSIKRGEPAQFALNQVIKGWTEGLQLMSTGAKYKFYIPYDLGYGEAGHGPDIAPFATLIFEVDLIEITKQEPASVE